MLQKNMMRRLISQKVKHFLPSCRSLHADSLRPEPSYEVFWHHHSSQRSGCRKAADTDYLWLRLKKEQLVKIQV